MPTDGRRILFDSPVLRVLDRTLPGDTGVVVVTFPARSGNQGLERKGFGEDFLRRHGVSAVHLTASWNHWFQVPDTEAALAAVRVAVSRFRRVVTYGSSMGGYGAVACSRALGADAILAISPQCSVRRGAVPDETRWAADAAAIERECGFGRDDLLALIAREAALHLAYDPRMRDRRHADAILALSADPRPLVLPFAGHPAGHALLAAGTLRGWVLGVVAGEDVSRTRQEFRKARRDMPLWWAGLASATARRPGGLGLVAARRARDLAPDDIAVAKLVARPLRLQGARPEALAAETMIAARRHARVGALVTRARAYLSRGQRADALRLLDAAAVLDPDDAAVQTARAAVSNEAENLPPGNRAGEPVQS